VFFTLDLTFHVLRSSATCTASPPPLLNIQRPNGPTNRVLGGDGKIVGVVNDIGSTILGWNEALQSTFVKGTNLYSKTKSVEIKSRLRGFSALSS
jgi:hypothetical protein